MSAHPRVPAAAVGAVCEDFASWIWSQRPSRGHSRGVKPNVTETTGVRPGEVAVIEELLDGCAQGDLDALARLYDTASARIFGLMSRITHDDEAAGQLTVALFHRVWDEADQRPTGPGHVWLISTAHRMAVEHRRRTIGRLSVAPSWLGLPSQEEAAVVVRHRELSGPTTGALDDEEERMLALTYLDAHTMLETEKALGLHRNCGATPLLGVLERLAESAGSSWEEAS